MAAFKDITGRRFGRWTATSLASKNPTYWNCLCDCGAVVSVAATNLIKGRSQSCGCHRREVSQNNRTHGHTSGYQRTPEYSSWLHAKERCFNPKAQNFARYGGRGITMCDEWRHDFTVFLRHIGPRPKGCELDRINNDGHYEPGNVRWAPRVVQVRNTSVTVMVTHDSETLSLSEWSERTGISLGTLHSRRERGLPLFEHVKRGGFRSGHLSRRRRRAPS